MAVSNALLRHITIDACLKDSAHKYALPDLIEACVKASGSKVSARTVQLDLQFMRDKKKGYNAPIVVYGQKYYKYKDPSYSIKQANVRQDNLLSLSDIAATLQRYSELKGLEALSNVVELINELLDNKTTGDVEKISMPARPKLSAGHFLGVMKDAVSKRRVLSISYIPENIAVVAQTIFYPLYMTVWDNRWWAIGIREGSDSYTPIALDDITGYSYAFLDFPPNYTFDPESYFADIMGVTKPNLPKADIVFTVKAHLSNYLIANPLHRSQRLLSKEENNNCTFHISIIPNKEFYEWTYKMQPNVTILSPSDCIAKSADFIKNAIKDVEGCMPPPVKKAPKRAKKKASEPNMFSLFPNL